MSITCMKLLEICSGLALVLMMMMKTLRPGVLELEAMQIEDNESNSAVLGNECISVVIITN